jgi:hypothetical protein
MMAQRTTPRRSSRHCMAARDHLAVEADVSRRAAKRTEVGALAVPPLAMKRNEIPINRGSCDSVCTAMSSPPSCC